MAKSRIFIIGGSGYLGTRLLDAIPNGVERYATSTLGGDGYIKLVLDEQSTFSNIQVHAGDILLLAAAISSPDICANNQKHAWEINVTGTSALISSVIARGARVIFFSSDTVYGEKKEEFNESATCNPVGDYAVMKHEVERRFLGCSEFKSIRLSYVFSQDDKFTKYLIMCAHRNEVAELFHPFYRSVIHIDDVVEGVIALAQRWAEFPQQIVNFAGDRVVSRVDFAETIKKIVLGKLNYRITEPGEEFFASRPKIIAMRSTLLPLLLGRRSHSLEESMRIEFDAN